MKMSNKKSKKINFLFVALPREVFKSKEYTALSTRAIKLLIDLYVQFNGRNNGDFSLAWKVMSQKGWRSKGTLERAKKELLEKSFIEETRKGGRHCCALYAVTWLDVDYCDSKLDFRKSYTKTNAWKNEKIAATKTGSMCNHNEVNGDD